MMHIERDQDGTIRRTRSRRPSDFHLHLRKKALMRAVLRAQLSPYLYGLVMPNDGPVRTIDEARARKEEILHLAREQGVNIRDIVVTLYHTELVTPAVVEQMARLWDQGVRIAVKQYPVHKPNQQGTTGSGLGLHLEDNAEAIRAMAETGIPLLIHCEDVEDKNGNELPHELREAHYVKNRLWKLRDRNPRLRLCCEHVSTRELVEFIQADHSGRTVGTVTPQHVWFDSSWFDRSWGVHLRCMPIVKTPEDRDAVTDFMINDARAILGTDSAPHPLRAKNKPFMQAACGCFTPHAIGMYAAKFIQKNAMGYRFERFSALAGPEWWQLPVPSDNDLITIRFERETDIPDPVPIPEEDDIVVPLGWTKESDKLKVGYSL